MPKKIIICCDGTWNKREERVNGEVQPTNVVKIMRALLPTDEAGVDQVVYYDTGVGTAGLWDKFVGGAFGVGLSNHVKDAYRFIANNYGAGDEIFCFGFSRGAYTVRSLSGLIGSVGLLDKSKLEYLPEAYKYYRTPPSKRPTSQYRDAAFVDDPARRHVAITFMGVWDTVGALGIPVRGLRWISRRWVGFHNTELSGNIKYAYQALAIDEQRAPFAPALWTTLESKPEAGHLKPRVLQVWLPGVHSNIGGGYSHTGLSDSALRWMVNRAAAHGLAFDQDFLRDRVKPNPINGVLVDSFTWPYKLLWWISPRYQRPIARTDVEMMEMLHTCVPQRMDQCTTSYAPANVMDARTRNVPEFKERRYSRRIVNWPAALIISGREIACLILDFSAEGGARIQAKADVPMQASVELTSAQTGTSRGRVVWQRNDLAGLRFRS
ncbi:MAG: DUF2235 domain-containing protein [Gemmatimonadales bacterium]|nr:DUF2235 domain-containing protein [Gemmatimonadales bacterium]NIN48592.1 DUF2235 domain-containing protein [Gemmatimonadales bacterium]NIP06056.1 DUF2235 domain-containing protein [Gemmatimonadales bacterium]NIQ98613.1 DUF2235 domain-containing protein [Gemmatimonadales bacterium]NIS63533.1 DUF2235 domain-containing protein [Gemmatimonadales bacterium]